MRLLNFDNVEIFRTGESNGVRFDHDMLDGLVQAFNMVREALKVPVMFGNLEMGRVFKLRRSGDALIASFARLPLEAHAVLKRCEYRDIALNIYRNGEYDGASFPWVLKSVDVLGAKLPDEANASEPLRALMFRQNQPRGERVVFRWSPELALPSNDDSDLTQIRSAFESTFRGALLKLTGSEQEADEGTARAMNTFDAELAKRKKQ